MSVTAETAEWGLDAGEQRGCAACQAHSHAWIAGKHPGSRDQAGIEVGIQEKMPPGVRGIRLEAGTCEGAQQVEGRPRDHQLGGKSRVGQAHWCPPAGPVITRCQFPRRAVALGPGSL